MTTLVEPVAVQFNDDSFIVELDDGRTLGVPLAWFPRLFHAKPKQRENFYLSRAGIHWEELDDNKGGASPAVIRKYCMCMNEKMDDNETQSISTWEKSHPKERAACDKESGWK